MYVSLNECEFELVKVIQTHVHLISMIIKTVKRSNLLAVRKVILLYHPQSTVGVTMILESKQTKQVVCLQCKYVGCQLHSNQVHRLLCWKKHD